MNPSNDPSQVSSVSSTLAWPPTCALEVELVDDGWASVIDSAAQVGEIELPRSDRSRCAHVTVGDVGTATSSPVASRSSTVMRSSAAADDHRAAQGEPAVHQGTSGDQPPRNRLPELDVAAEGGVAERHAGVRRRCLQRRVERVPPVERKRLGHRDAIEVRRRAELGAGHRDTTGEAGALERQLPAKVVASSWTASSKRATRSRRHRTPVGFSPAARQDRTLEPGAARIEVALDRHPPSAAISRSNVTSDALMPPLTVQLMQQRIGDHADIREVQGASDGHIPQVDRSRGEAGGELLGRHRGSAHADRGAVPAAAQHAATGAEQHAGDDGDTHGPHADRAVTPPDANRAAPPRARSDATPLPARVCQPSSRLAITMRLFVECRAWSTWYDGA